MFGMTEGMVFAAAPTTSRSLRHQTVGHPVSPGDEVRLLIPGEETEVAFGEIGELCFRGPSTVTGYFADPETTRASFTSDGFFRSGDLMRAHRMDGLSSIRSKDGSRTTSIAAAKRSAPKRSRASSSSIPTLRMSGWSRCPIPSTARRHAPT